LPGEFFHTYIHTTHTLDPVNYATHLKTVMQKLSQQRKTHITKDLHTCPFVFVRNNAVKRPLQPPYDEPFKALQWTDKHFTLDINGKKKLVSLDRLKSAYMDDTLQITDDITSADDTTPTEDTSSTQDQQPTSTDSPPPPVIFSSKTTPQVTRSGRHVHWPRKLAEYRSLTQQLTGGGVLWQQQEHHFTIKVCSLSTEVMQSGSFLPS